MKKVKLGLVKKIISIVGLASIASIPAIALVSCSNDSSSSDSGSSGNSSGNNNPGGSGQNPSDPSQQKQYLSFASDIKVIPGFDTGVNNLQMVDSYKYEEMQEEVKSGKYKWFENGQPIKYKVSLSLDNDFYVTESQYTDFKKPFDSWNFFKKIGNENKINAELVFWKKVDNNNINSFKNDFKSQVLFDGQYYDNSKFWLAPSFYENVYTYGRNSSYYSLGFIVSNDGVIVSTDSSFDELLCKEWSKKNSNLFLYGSEAYTNTDPFKNKLYFDGESYQGDSFIPTSIFNNFYLKYVGNNESNVGTFKIEKFNQ